MAKDDSAPLVVGINRTQDGSICVMRGSQVLCCIQKERLTRQKHHWGKLGDLRDVYAKSVPGLDEPIDVLVECYSSDREAERLSDYEREI
ncbi:MAG TPA: carbamoyltransferase, partial [Burkholderiaceae bacterium]|nr:carbamoyltransferase [Burkholderiaceae bacterium]